MRIVAAMSDRQRTADRTHAGNLQVGAALTVQQAATWIDGASLTGVAGWNR